MRIKAQTIKSSLLISCSFGNTNGFLRSLEAYKSNILEHCDMHTPLPAVIILKANNIIFI